MTQLSGQGSGAGPCTISVVVVSYNSIRYLDACLGSVRDQRCRCRVETVVVDNASADGSPGLVRSAHPGALLIENADNLGFARAVNMGVKASTGDYVLLLNPDAVLGAGALETLSSFLSARREAGAAGPAIFNEDGSPQRTGVAFPSAWNLAVELFFLDALFPRSRTFGRHRRLYEPQDEIRAVDTLQGSCLMIKREALDRVGILDESYFMYFEETDLCLRLKQAGWSVFSVPGARAVHHGGSGFPYYDRARLGHFYRSYAVFLRKHCGAGKRLLMTLLLAARACVRSALFLAAAAAAPARRKEYRERGAAYGAAAASLFRSAGS